MAESKNKKGLLPRIEMIIIAIFFVSFIFIMIPKCESDQSITDATSGTEAVDGSMDTLAALLPQQLEPARIERNRTVLYATIDGLNMREEPHLASPILKRLKLYEEVYYLNELTEKRQTIDWGSDIVTEEPWLKVQTDDGRIGWVYGAGLHFYKKQFLLPAEE